MQYEVQILRHVLRDRLEWDLCSSLTPEAFARTLTRDLGLTLESGVLISHAIREQLLHHRRAAMELGLFGSGKIYRSATDELLQVYKEEQERAQRGESPGADDGETRLPTAADASTPGTEGDADTSETPGPPATRSRRMAAGASDATNSTPFLIPDKSLPLPVRKERALATLRDLLTNGPRPLEGVWRDFQEAHDFGPLLEYLSEAEMEKMEEAELRASRYVASRHNPATRLTPHAGETGATRSAPRGGGGEVEVTCHSPHSSHALHVMQSSAAPGFTSAATAVFSLPQTTLVHDGCVAARGVHGAWLTRDPAVGKNKKLAKGKGTKKRAVDPFTRKEWYEIKAPTFFENRNVGKTFVNRSQGLSTCGPGVRETVLTVYRERQRRAQGPHPGAVAC